MKTKFILLFSIVGILFIAYIFLFSKDKIIETEVQKVIPVEEESLPVLDYEDFKNEIKKRKSSLQDINQAKDYLFKIYNEDIPAYWTGTKWDFNGMTRTPKEGEIACGYFVTNTLTDVGFNIKRIKLAQSAASVIIKNVCGNLKRFSDFEKFKKHIAQHPDNSVFIVGLDFHTGFILKAKDEVYFLHSNYIQREGVIKEKIDESIALKASKAYSIGSLSANTELINKWMN